MFGTQQAKGQTSSRRSPLVSICGGKTAKENQPTRPSLPEPTETGENQRQYAGALPATIGLQAGPTNLPAHVDKPATRNPLSDAWHIRGLSDWGDTEDDGLGWQSHGVCHKGVPFCQELCHNLTGRLSKRNQPRTEPIHAGWKLVNHCWQENQKHDTWHPKDGCSCV